VIELKKVNERGALLCFEICISGSNVCHKKSVLSDVCHLTFYATVGTVFTAAL
jgi:hypothetical protein